jgi:hypothetical protein
MGGPQWFKTDPGKGSAQEDHVPAAERSPGRRAAAIRKRQIHNRVLVGPPNCWGGGDERIERRTALSKQFVVRGVLKDRPAADALTIIAGPVVRLNGILIGRAAGRIFFAALRFAAVTAWGGTGGCRLLNRERATAHSLPAQQRAGEECGNQQNVRRSGEHACLYKSFQNPLGIEVRP